MERRHSPRLTVQFEAKVTHASNVNQSTCGRVFDISEAGISVALSIQFVAGDPVQVEMGDSTLLGHVVYANADDSMFRTGIQISEVRLGTTELSKLLHRTLSEALPETTGLEIADTCID